MDSSGRGVLGFSAERVERRDGNVSSADDAPTEYFEQRLHLQGNANGASDAPACSAFVKEEISGQSSPSSSAERVESLSMFESPVASAEDVLESCKARFQTFNMFGLSVQLPAGSYIVNKLGKIVEVAGDFTTAFVRHLQSQHHPDLLVDLVDGLLVFHMPSSSVTDCLHLLEPQVGAYLQRHRRQGEISSKSSSSLFHVPGQVQRMCPDFTIHDSRGYQAKVEAALARNRTIPQDVTIYATFEMQSYSQSEDEIRDTCRRQAALVDCVSIALLVKTGMVEIYDRMGLRHAEFNPCYIHVGGYAHHLQGLRLYMQPLRDAGCWNFPSPHNFPLIVNQSALIDAISTENFELAEEIVNYMGDSVRDKGLLQFAVEKAAQQVPGALQFVHFFLDNGAHIDSETRCISTMLTAMAADDGPLTALLRRYGAPTSLSLTADDLVFAVDTSDTRLVRLLLRAGCDPNVLSSDGRLATIEAIPRIALVDAIIDAAGYLDFYKKDRFGKSAREYAKSIKAFKVVEKLDNKLKMQGGGPKKTYLSKLISNALFKKSNKRNKQREARV